MNDSVSIIVPLYNKENLVGRCVESLISQTYSFIEIILVDDGSTDNSWNICKAYENKDNRIKALRKENGGLSDARNYGLAQATGKWISFVDGDDYVENNYIEELLRHSEGVDIVVCCCYMITSKKRTISSHVFGNRLFEGKGSIYDNVLIPMITLDRKKTNMLFPAWNKLYRRQVIESNHLKYDTSLPYSEDYIFSIHFYKAASNIQFIDAPLYDYDCTVPGTLSKVHVSTDKLERYNYIHYKVAELFPEKGKEVLPMVILNDCKHHIRLYARLSGLDGFKSFCNDVYNMDAFKEVSENDNLGLPAPLRRNNYHILFIFWAYLYSLKSFAKYYSSKVLKR